MQTNFIFFDVKGLSLNRRHLINLCWFNRELSWQVGFWAFDFSCGQRLVDEGDGILFAFAGGVDFRKVFFLIDILRWYFFKFLDGTCFFLRHFPVGIRDSRGGLNVFQAAVVGRVRSGSVDVRIRVGKTGLILGQAGQLIKLGCLLFRGVGQVGSLDVGVVVSHFAASLSKVSGNHPASRGIRDV